MDKKEYIKKYRLENSAKIKQQTQEYRNAHKEEAEQRNKLRTAQYRLNSRLKNIYGLSLEEYYTLLKQTGGLCPICRNEFDDNIKKNAARSPVIDHDHKTNKVRGIICNHCNRALGLLGENSENMLRAIEWIKE